MWSHISNTKRIGEGREARMETRKQWETKGNWNLTWSEEGLWVYVGRSTGGEERKEKEMNETKKDAGREPKKTLEVKVSRDVRIEKEKGIKSRSVS